jgi:pimeloyl-ACP methyl ester carboxylesterase
MGWREELLEEFVAHGYRALRFDNRDVGLSQHYPGGQYTIEDMAADAKALLDALGVSRVHVVGQSLGGMIAQEFAIHFPERVTTLTLVFTAAGSHHIKSSTRGVDEMRDAVRAHTKAEAIEAYILAERECASTAYPFDERWKRELAELMWHRSWDPGGALRQREAIERSRDRTALVGSIEAPTLILHGSADRLIGSDAGRELHELIAGSRLCVIPGMGHELPREVWPEFVKQFSENAALAEMSSAPD